MTRIHDHRVLPEKLDNEVPVPIGKARARLKARANSLKSGSINFVRRGSRRMAMKKYRGKGRRNFDTSLHYNSL